MIRGKILFKCDECGKWFRALDIEYNAMIFSVPMPCPRCGSRHTYPPLSFPFKSTYKKIWKEMDKKTV